LLARLQGGLPRFAVLLSLAGEFEAVSTRGGESQQFLQPYSVVRACQPQRQPRHNQLEEFRSALADKLAFFPSIKSALHASVVEVDLPVRYVLEEKPESLPGLLF
jgi:hypothetical protein